ncbi:MAG TPA: DUF2243 domain-containing protein [Rhizobacter sp.]
MNPSHPAPDAAPSVKALSMPGLLLGIALGGFFDGILLHQVLQWHHLLSGVGAVADLRLQLLADGLFHLLMYVMAAVALLALWRRRAALGGAGAGARLAGMAALGFAGWHVLDAVLSHWVLGLHRIRMDVPNPLAWDLGWLAVFGLLPALAGLAWLRRAGGGPGGSGRGIAASLALAVLVGGPLAALPSPGDQVMVFFDPRRDAASHLRTLARADARLLWVDRSGTLWAVKLADRRATRELYAGGAWFVSSSALALGCVAWSRPPV